MYQEIPLRHLEWFDAAELDVKGMEGAKLLKCYEFDDAIIANRSSTCCVRREWEPKGSRFFMPFYILRASLLERQTRDTP